MGFWKRLKGRRAAAPEPAARAYFRRRDEMRRQRRQRADAWRAAELTTDRIQAEYEARRTLLAEPLRPWARPIAAWALREGEPRVTSSYMGGRPALHPDEEWPGGDDPMRFWAQVDLADLAPYAGAFSVALPSSGLVQLFAGDEGGEYARYVTPADLDRFELRAEIPVGPLWDGVEDAEAIHRRSLLIELYPEALVPWQEVGDLLPDDHPSETFTTSEDLPGYSFGWWPFSSWSLTDGLFGWPETRPKPRPEEWVFLAVCDSNRELGLAFSDEGFLWATAPAADLAAGSFEQLRCDGESS